jgi:hypothetical protein
MTPVPPTPAAARLPVLESVREGFAFVARDWRAILPIALLAAVAIGGLQVFADLARARQDLGTSLLATCAVILVQVVLMAALLRRALSQGEAPLAVGFGRDEANLTGVVVSLGFLYFILAVFALLFTSMCLGVLAVGAKLDPDALQGLPPEEQVRQFAAALGSDGLLVLVVLVIAFAGLFLWIAARVMLSHPATVAEGRMFVFSTWAWTKGNDLRLVACLLLLVLAGLMLALIALAPFGVALDMAFGKGAQVNPSSPAHWILSVLGGFANVMLSTAPYAGMAAFLYRGLRPAIAPPTA